MLRVASLAFLLLLTVPLAQAAPPPGPIAVGPDGLADPGEPYYLRATLSRPEGPAVGSKEGDCNAGMPRPGPEDAAKRLAGPVLAWDPVSEPRVSGWFPTCAGLALRGPCSSDGTCPEETAYASYDVRTGRYYLEARPPADGFLPAQRAAQPIVVTGTSGLAMDADCEYCPPPGALG